MQRGSGVCSREQKSRVKRRDNSQKLTPFLPTVFLMLSGRFGGLNCGCIDERACVEMYGNAAGQKAAENWVRGIKTTRTRQAGGAAVNAGMLGQQLCGL